MTQFLGNDVRMSRNLGLGIAVAYVLAPGLMRNHLLKTSANRVIAAEEKAVKEKTSADFECLRRAEEKRARKRLKRLEIL